MPTETTSPAHCPRSRVGLSSSESSAQARCVSTPTFHIRFSRGSGQLNFPSGSPWYVRSTISSEKVRVISEEIVERTYHGEPEGKFSCPDPLLNRIWNVGVETHRACAEDSLEDNPTRERGQWAGDVVSVGMDVAASAYSDLRLCRRGLIQCAQSAREDGLVSGLCPGGGAYL